MQDGSYNSLDDATFVTWSLFAGGICYEDVIFVLVKNKTRLVQAARRTWVAEPVRLRRLTESARELSTGVANTQRLYAESTMSWRGAGNRSGAR